MKILIDGYEANVEQRLGSSQVAFELLRNFEKSDSKNEYLILLPLPPLDDLPKERPGWSYKILKPTKLWTKIALPLFLYTKGKNYELIFSPTHYIPRFSPIKRIATIFDLSFLRYPEYFTKRDLWQLRAGTKFSVENADSIITISNNSKKDIINFYKTDKNERSSLSDKITVAPPGYDKDKFEIQNSKFEIEEVKKKYNTGDNYIIYIGTIQPRKNLIRLMEAVSRIENLNLLIVGKHSGDGREGWMYEEILETPKKLGIENRVKFAGFIETNELANLLGGAKAYINPSLYEGFGIPVLEAMAVGVPVLVSNNSSMIEVCGEAGLGFNPNSVTQIEQAIRTVITDKKLSLKMSKMGLKRVSQFSWKKMAKKVISVFETL